MHYWKKGLVSLFFEYIFFILNYFFVFLNYFNFIILKINLKKQKGIVLIYFKT